MPTVSTYAPPPVRRYFALDNDPNSALGGSSYDTINGNATLGITADSTNFPGAVIADVTKIIPVSSAQHAWTPTRINFNNLVTGQRAGKPEVPFKVQPTIQFTADAHRFIVEKTLKLALGSEGTITGAGPYVHPLSGLPFGANLQPTAVVQHIRDAINFKSTGVAVESVELTFPFDGPGTVAVEAHALYTQLIDDHLTPVMPSGTIAEPTKLPLLLRDATVFFLGGATAQVGVSQFTFGYKQNGGYDRQIAGACIASQTLAANLYKLWFPAYHKLSGRPTVTFGLNFLDALIAQELAMEWAQIEKIQVTLVDPQGGTDQVSVILYAASVMDGGIDALVAAGDQSQSFTGQAFYSQSDGTDILVNVTNSIATAI